VGGAEAPRPPSFFECWDDSQLHKEEAITKSAYSCNLQFTPAIEGVGEVAAVTIQVEHFAVARNAFGFFGWLPQHATSHNGVTAIDPKGGHFSPPRCALAAASARRCESTRAPARTPSTTGFDLTRPRPARAQRPGDLFRRDGGFRPSPSLARRPLDGCARRSSRDRAACCARAPARAVFEQLPITIGAAPRAVPAN
jgi:hypothetical protein